MEVPRRVPAMTEGAPSTTQLAQARRLWYGSHAALLSSHSQDPPGYPFGSLAPFWLTPQGEPLLLLSHLARHTQNLLANPRCSLLLREEGPGDVQQLARLTCLAQAEPLQACPTQWRNGYFRHFPDGREYYEHLNFRFLRLRPQGFYFIGGFGSARWFDPSRLLPSCVFTQQEEEELLPRAQAIYDAHRADPPLLLVGVDGYGATLRNGPLFTRIQFDAPTEDPADLLESLHAHLISTPDVG